MRLLALSVPIPMAFAYGTCVEYDGHVRYVAYETRPFVERYSRTFWVVALDQASLRCALSAETDRTHDVPATLLT